MTAPTLPTIQTLAGHACPPAPGHSPEHSVTVHIPTWQTLVDFVELKPGLIGSLKNIYPRMMALRPVVQLCEQVAKALDVQPNKSCLIYPTRLTADACKDFSSNPARKEGQISADQIELHALSVQGSLFFALVFPLEGKGTVMSYWRNAGICSSTRYAEFLSQGIDSLREVPLDTAPPIIAKSAAHATVQERIASLIDRAPLHTAGRRPTGPSDVYLYQTGMAAIYHPNQYLRKIRDGTTILFNFAFHSTPHALEDYSSGYKFFGKGTEYDDLEDFLRTETQQGRRIQSLLTEFPANPLLTTANLSKLRSLADKYDFILFVDDTVGSFANIDLFGPAGADVLVTSLSKSFSGYADLLAGSAVLNPSSSRHSTLKPLFDSLYTNELFAGDAEVLESNSRDYLQRQATLNQTAATLTDHLHKRAADLAGGIARVWYPTYAETSNNYIEQMRPATEDFVPGYGCLFSVELRTNAILQAWYDCIGNRLHIGPHLGAHFTLVLPYCKGIYGKDLGAVGAFGLNERQVRVSVGLEDVQTLIAIFDEAEKAGLEAEEKAKQLPPLQP